MSIHLMSLVWEVRFPTHVQKLVMLKIADYASDDGGSVFPAVATLAYQVGCDERSVQRATRALEGPGLLRRVHSGGGGPKDTNQIEINVDFLIELAYGSMLLEGNSTEVTAVENMGDTTPPSTMKRVASVLKRVASVQSKGGAHATQTINNHQITFSAHARASDEGARAASAPETTPAPSLVPTFEIQEGDPSWGAWLTWMETYGHQHRAEAARIGRSMMVASKWPNDKSAAAPLVPKWALAQAEAAELSKRMTGEQE